VVNSAPEVPSCSRAVPAVAVDSCDSKAEGGVEEVQNNSPPLLNNMGGHRAKLGHKVRMNQNDDTPRRGRPMKGHKNPPKREAASK
jgi:hypothetical protein